MKRIKPSIFVRVLSGWQVGLKTLLALCTIGGLLIGLLNIHEYDWFRAYYAIILVILISVLAAFFAGIQKMLPDLIIDELSRENSYIATYCDSLGLKEADEMTKPYFGNSFIPFNQIEQWRLKNPNGFVQIKNSEGLLCACFVILGLSESFIDQFIRGRLTENDISSDDVLDIVSTKKLNRIYISGVVVRDPNSYMGRKRAMIMLWTILQYINKIYGLRKRRQFFAIAITPESEKLLQALEFELIGNKRSRKDQCNLYKITLDRQTWDNLQSRLGSYSKMVELRF